MFTLELILLLTAIRNTTHPGNDITLCLFSIKETPTVIMFYAVHESRFCLSCVCVGVASVCNHKVT